MGWFEKQIEKRIREDNGSFSTAVSQIANAVHGGKQDHLSEGPKADDNAIAQVLRFFHLKLPELPDDVSDFQGRLELAMHSHGIMQREVRLTPKWYRDCFGVMIGFRKDDGSPVALLPGAYSGYRYYDREKGRTVRLDSRNQNLFQENAIVFYRPLPMKKLNVSELVKYIAGLLHPADYFSVFVLCLCGTLISMVMPELKNILINRVIGSGEPRLLVAIVVFMFSVACVTALLLGAKFIINARFYAKLSVNLQSALMARLLCMPASFFRKYKSGELANYINSLNDSCVDFVCGAFSWGLALLLALLYIVRMRHYTPTLVLPTLGIHILIVLYAVISAPVQKDRKSVV